MDHQSLRGGGINSLVALGHKKVFEFSQHWGGWHLLSHAFAVNYHLMAAVCSS